MVNDESLTVPGEWKQWAVYFGQLFPTANCEWIKQMCDRMMRTLRCDAPEREMGGIEYHARLEQLLESVNRLPPDHNNKLMGAG